MRFLQLVGVFLRLSGLNELQYRANFFMQLFNSLLDLVFGLAGLGLVFYHTESLSGWTPPELLAVLGVYTLISGLIRAAIQPNMARLMDDVSEGTLDYILIKPEDSQVLVSIWEFQVWKTLDIPLGLGVLGVAVSQMEANFGLQQAIQFAVLLGCGGLIVYGFWLILSTTSFWLVRIFGLLELFQSIYQTGRWPITIYPAWLRMTLTFLIPVAFAVTVPAQALTARLADGMLPAALALTAGILLVGRMFWKAGVKRYSGASA